MAEFETPEALLEAAQHARAAGYEKLDAYSPHPVKGLAEAVGFTKNRVPLAVLLGGLFGGALAYFMQWYANVVSYPINVGGRPYHSWPSFMPITFEVTVLFAAFAALLAMLALNRLPKPYHPVFGAPGFERASQDRFFLCIEAADPKFDAERTGRLLRETRPLSIHEVMP